MSVARDNARSQPTESPQTNSPVQHRFATVRTWTLWQRGLVDAGRTIVLLLLLLGGLMLLDSRLVLETPLRALGLVSVVGLVSWFVVRQLRRRYRYETRDVAADVEARYSDYGQQLRTSLDYGKGEGVTPASPEMVAMLQQDTREKTEHENFGEVVRLRPVILTAFAVMLVLISGLVWMSRRPELWTTLGRVALLPLHYSRVTVEPFDEPVPAGQTAIIEAVVEGRPVKSAEVLYRVAEEGGAWKTLKLKPAPQAGGDRPQDEAAGEEANAAKTPPALIGALQATIDDCQQDLEFKVVAGPLDGEIHRIRVLQPLEMDKFTAQINAPEYTRKEPESTDKMDLKVLEGSDVQLEMNLSRVPAEAQLVPLDKQGQPQAEAAVPLAIEETALKVNFEELADSRSYVFTAKTADGMGFTSPRLRIKVQPDARPRIRFVKPPEELEVTPTTEVTLAVEVGDDFGVQRIGVAVKIADEPMRTLWSQDFGEDEPGEIQLRPKLLLEEHELDFQDAVTYYAFAEDNHPGGDRRTTTELRFIDIRPYKREFQIINASGGS